jgi:hypothetical protein
MAAQGFWQTLLGCVLPQAPCQMERKGSASKEPQTAREKPRLFNACETETRDVHGVRFLWLGKTTRSIFQKTRSFERAQKPKSNHTTFRHCFPPLVRAKLVFAVLFAAFLWAITRIAPTWVCQSFVV